MQTFSTFYQQFSKNHIYTLLIKLVRNCALKFWMPLYIWWRSFWQTNQPNVLNAVSWSDQNYTMWLQAIYWTSQFLSIENWHKWKYQLSERSILRKIESSENEPISSHKHLLSGKFDIPKMKPSSLRNERFMIQCWKDQLSERSILRKKYNYHSDMERSVSLGISR